VDSKNLRTRPNQPGKSKAVKKLIEELPVYEKPAEEEAEAKPIGQRVRYVDTDQKIDVEIRDIIRIKPSDFSALKNSFEEWAKQWE
jgi:hypothetical protein